MTRRKRLVLLLVLAACGSDGPSTGQTGAACGPVDLEAAGDNILQKIISAPATLKKSCSPYRLVEPLTVLDHLTIEAGVTIEACMGGCRSRITVARDGKITAVGREDDPIVFTSVWRQSMAGPPRGQWTGILFLEAAVGSRLEQVRIEHGGGPWETVEMDDEFGMYEFPRQASLMVDSTEGIVVQDLRIETSREYAVAVTTSDEMTNAGSDVFMTFERVTVADSEKGMWLPVDQGASLGQISYESPGAGVYTEMHLDDVVGRTPESVRRDATWRPTGAPWLAESVNVENGALLTIADGVELRMTDLGGIFVGVSGAGALDMQAAAPGGIRVLAASDGQYWDGLYVWSLADGARTQIANVDLGFGGKKSPRIDQSAPAVLGIYTDGASGAQPSVRGVHVHDSLGAGIHWNCLSTPAGLEPSNEGNTSDDGSIACAAAIGAGIAENQGCACPGSCADIRCPQPE
jgi:hypothetical protein